MEIIGYVGFIGFFATAFGFGFYQKPLHIITVIQFSVVLGLGVGADTKLGLAVLSRWQQEVSV